MSCRSPPEPWLSVETEFFPQITDILRWRPAPRSGVVSANKIGGARRDRTDDIVLAKHALSQLSYGPKLRQRGALACVSTQEPSRTAHFSR
jgi:hypothetical protein